MKHVIIASLFPTFLILLSISMIGTPAPIHEHGSVDGTIVLGAVISVVPGAVIAFFCGKQSSEDKE